MRIICTFIVLIASALAQCTGSPSCTVKAGGGGGYTTIQACASAMAAGDTCTVFAGTYAEDVTASAGTVGNYKTFAVNASDAVIVHSFTLASHVKVIGNCSVPSTQGTCGFSIQNTSSPNSRACILIPSGTTDFFVTGDNLYACGSGVMIHEQSPSYGSFGFIQNNTFSYGCSTSSAPNVCAAMDVNGDHWLVEGNDISHVSDGISRAGSFGVIRTNMMHDTTPADCGTNSNNCHIDFVQSEPPITTQFNMFENNTVVNNLSAVGNTSNAHVFLAQGDACAGSCDHLIVRFNTGAHVDEAAMINDNARNISVTPGFAYVKDYNNTWVDFGNPVQGTTISHTFNSTHGSEINELFYYPGSYTGNPYIDSEGGAESTDATFTSANNLAWCTGTCTLYGKTYQLGTFASGTGNVQSDPLFVSYSSTGLGNLNLQVGSPARSAGSSLTTAVGAGTTSTALTVADAAFFQDGYGITGVQADWIRIGASTTVQISSVNYSTNVITLASPVSWSNGASVYLYKDSNGKVLLSGASPSIGSQQDAIAPAFSVVTPYSGVPVSVSLSTSSGSVICWTTNGTTPATDASAGCNTGTLYSSPIAINSTATLKAISGGTGYVDSGVTSGVYTITSATPSDMAVQGLTINRLTISQ